MNEQAKQKILNFLQSHASAVLSTTNPDNSPYAAAIYVVTDDKLNFYFLTKLDTQKSQNLKHNNKAALTMIDPAKPVTLQVTGSIEEVKDPDSLLQMFIKIAEENAQLQKDFHWPPPLAKLRGTGGLVMYKFFPNWIRLADFSESEDVTETSEKLFYELKPQDR